MNRPSSTAGLRHLALFITNFEDCLHFYQELLGMTVDWQPDADNIYLTSGVDNLALHRARASFTASGQQRLDHFGFILETPQQVDEWHDFLKSKNVAIKTIPRTHRDGSRSFYCLDPDGNTVQMIYHPNLIAV